MAHFKRIHIAYNYTTPNAWGYGRQDILLSGTGPTAFGMSAGRLKEIEAIALKRCQEDGTGAIKLVILSWQPFDYEDEPTEEKA